MIVAVLKKKNAHKRQDGTGMKKAAKNIFAALLVGAGEHGENG